MRICSKCGTINEDKARFCENCGAKLENAAVIGETAGAAQASASVPAEKPQAPDSPPPSQESSRTVKQIQIKVPQINVDKLKSEGLKTGQSIKAVSRAVKVVAAEAVLLVVLLCIFFTMGSSKGDPANVAEKYFKAYVEKDWPAVYRMTDFPVSAFLTEENYINLMESAKSEDIINFKVKEKKQKKSEKEKLLESFTVEYTVKGEANYRSMGLNLLRQNEKTMLFFPIWRVSPEGMLAEDFDIYVPEDSEVVLDHIPLLEEDLAPQPEQDRGWDHYQATIFSGSHEIQVAAPWQEVQRQEFSTYQSDHFQAEDMRFTDQAMDAIEGTVKSAMEQLYQSAMEENDFSSVAGLFDGAYKEQNQEVYERLLSDLNEKGEYRLDQVTFNKFKPSLSGRTDDGAYQILAVRLEYGYVSDYTHTYHTWTGQSRSERKQDNGTGELRAGLLYDGESYKLAWIDMRSVF